MISNRPQIFNQWSWLDGPNVHQHKFRDTLRHRQLW